MLQHDQILDSAAQHTRCILTPNQRVQRLQRLTTTRSQRNCELLRRYTAGARRKAGSPTTECIGEVIAGMHLSTAAAEAADCYGTFACRACTTSHR